MEVDRLFLGSRTAEGFLELLLQFAALRHRAENVGIAIEIAGDENLRQRRPIVHRGKRFAFGHVFEHVDDLERIAEAVEELNRFERESAARCALGSFAVDEIRVFCDFALDLVVEFGASRVLSALMKRMKSAPPASVVSDYAGVERLRRTIASPAGANV